MLTEARESAAPAGLNNVQFVAGDAWKFSTTRNRSIWFFRAGYWDIFRWSRFLPPQAVPFANQGYSHLLCTRKNSPREQLEIFGQLAAQDPSVLLKRVAFDFPRDMNHVRQLLSAGFEISHLWDGKIVFRYNTPEEVSGNTCSNPVPGTAYYHYAIHPKRRDELQERFIETLARKNPPAGYEVIHDYICCIVIKPKIKMLIKKSKQSILLLLPGQAD